MPQNLRYPEMDWRIENIAAGIMANAFNQLLLPFRIPSMFVKKHNSNRITSDTAKLQRRLAYAYKCLFEKQPRTEINPGRPTGADNAWLFRPVMLADNVIAENREATYAAAWIFSDDTDPLSYLSLCAVLGLPPNEGRERARRIIEKRQAMYVSANKALSRDTRALLKKARLSVKESCNQLKEFSGIGVVRE